MKKKSKKELNHIPEEIIAGNFVRLMSKLEIQTKKELKNAVALQFPNEDEFSQAIRAAVDNQIFMDTPGKFTLIIIRKDKKHFRHFCYKEQKVVSAAKLSPEALSRFRQNLYGTPKPKTP